MSRQAVSAPYPLRWRLADAAERLRARLWPARAAGATPYLFLLPAFLIVFVLVLGLLYIGDYSLRTLDRSTFLLSDDYSLQNYARILERAGYMTVLWRTLLGAALVTAITLVLAFPYAYAMVRTPSPFLRKFLLFNLFLPFFLGQVVRAYGWLIILGHEGLLNSTLAVFGVGPVGILYTYPAVILGLVQYMLPFAVLMLAPALTAIAEEVEMASESLGANWWRTLWHVVLPMAKPGLVAATVVVFTISLTEYAIPAILGGGTNDFVANAIYDAFFRVSDAGLGSALAVVLVLLGSFLVAIAFAVLGAGTLSFMQRRPA